MKEILGWLGGGFVLCFSWFFSWWKIKNLKAKNKSLEQEVKYEEIAKDKKTNEARQLREVDQKTDAEIFENWEKK